MLIALENLKNAIETLPIGGSTQDLEVWKQNALAILESAINRPRPVEALPHAKLSPREHQVMTMLLEGRRLKEIGARLQISVKTVTTHRARLLRKLAIEDNLSLYRYAVRNGLIAA